MVDEGGEFAWRDGSPVTEGGGQEVVEHAGVNCMGEECVFDDVGVEPPVSVGLCAKDIFNCGRFTCSCRAGGDDGGAGAMAADRLIEVVVYELLVQECPAGVVVVNPMCRAGAVWRGCSASGGERRQLGGYGIAEKFIGIGVHRHAARAESRCSTRCASNSWEYSSKVNRFCWKAYSMSSQLPRS